MLSGIYPDTVGKPTIGNGFCLRFGVDSDKKNIIN